MRTRIRYLRADRTPRVVDAHDAEEWLPPTQELPQRGNQTALESDEYYVGGRGRPAP